MSRPVVPSHHRVALVAVLCVMLLTLGACAGLDADPVVRVPAPTTFAPTRTTAPTTTPTVPPVTPSVTPVAQPVRYLIDRSMASQQDALAAVRLVIREALLTNTGIDLTVAFENTGDTSFSVSGFVPAHDARLVDGWGQHYAPRNNTTD